VYGETHGKGGNDTFTDPKSGRHGIDTIEQWLLVLLQILVVGRGNSLEGHHESRHLAKDTSGFASEKFERIWVLLLWHDGRTGTAMSAIHRLGRMHHSCTYE